MVLWVLRVAIPAVLAITVACGSSAAPVRTEQGVVRNGDVELQWFLDFPVGAGPFPAVVFGPGSGQVSATDESTIDIARGLNGIGFAVMRYDKRGTGGSGGEVIEVSTANSDVTIPLLAEDMQAVLDQLLTDPRIDLQRVGLVGASQAAWYMPIVAQATAAVGFMVVITGGVAPVGFQNRYEELTRLDGISQEEAEAELGLLSDFTGPLGFNTIPILETLGIPLLYLFGGNDEFGPLRANLVAVGELAAAGVELEASVYDGAGHVLRGVDFWPDVASWLEGVW